MNYWPLIGKLRTAIEGIEGATWEEKASKVQVSPQALRRCLTFKAVRPITASYIAGALGKRIDELYFR